MKILSKAFLKAIGWTLDDNAPDEIFEKCVLICAPHTSNWDYPLAVAMMDILGIKARYALKKELMVFPQSVIFKTLGGISIDRSPRKEGEERPSTVQVIADLFDKHDKLCLLIASEGSRSLREEWKTGFYYIALKAKVPICLGYLNYETKSGGFGNIFYPSGDLQSDMEKIMLFYEDKVGKKPEKFCLDKRFYKGPEQTITKEKNQ
ncbi:MAG: 1-acyl-sn-glycerol-3-phosphate acyltransferase [Saprospiraceae bacterium]|nr:1-acyl-sn-glycerol-3-phosphate acyltransferase [Saprospiraceae bacterium]